MSERFLIKLSILEMKLRKRFKTGTSERGSWIAVAAVVISVVGAGVSAYGQYSQGQAQKKMYKYQADVAERQAQIDQQTSETNAHLTQYQASQDAKQLQRKYMIVEGAQKASRAASGLGGGGVTEGDIATDTFNTKNIDESMIRYNADLKSWGIRNQAAGEIWGLGTQINQYSFAGKNAAKAGAISATGTIFSGVGSAMGMVSKGGGGGGGSSKNYGEGGPAGNTMG